MNNNNYNNINPGNNSTHDNIKYDITNNKNNRHRDQRLRLMSESTAGREGGDGGDGDDDDDHVSAARGLGGSSSSTARDVQSLLESIAGPSLAPNPKFKAALLCNSKLKP